MAGAGRPAPCDASAAKEGGTLLLPDLPLPRLSLLPLPVVPGEEGELACARQGQDSGPSRGRPRQPMKCSLV